MADVPTIQDFYKVAQERDFNRQNQLRILAINAGPGFDVTFEEDDMVYIKTGKLPRREIATSGLAYMGLNFNIPGTASYPGSDSYTFTIWADQKFNLYNKFVEWTRQIFDDETSTGNYLASKSGATITLVAVDHELKPVKTLRLVGVTCKGVSDIEYDISNNGVATTFTVTCAYHYFEDIT